MCKCVSSESILNLARGKPLNWTSILPQSFMIYSQLIFLLYCYSNICKLHFPETHQPKGGKISDSGYSSSHQVISLTSKLLHRQSINSKYSEYKCISSWSLQASRFAFFIYIRFMVHLVTGHDKIIKNLSLRDHNHTNMTRLCNSGENYQTIIPRLVYQLLPSLRVKIKSQGITQN